MAIIVPQAGERELLRRIFETGDKTVGIIKVGLFKTAPTQGESLDYATIVSAALEVTNDDGDTYTRQIPASWAVSSSSDGVATGDEVTFTLAGKTALYNVYGYFVIIEKTGDIPNSKLLWYETFPVAFAIQTNPTGGTIKLILKMELD